jgi:predicted secreted hydrolase
MRRALPLLLILIVAIALWSWLGNKAGDQGNLPPSVQIDQISGSDEFAQAISPREFTLPLDHGPHLEFQTEWWYFTGNLDDQEGRHFGYQLTFFRRGLSPVMPMRDSDFATNQIYFAHFALTDVEGNVHLNAERFSRGAADLAGASGEPFRVWLESWDLESLAQDGSQLRIRADDGDLNLDLRLTALKPLVPHGEGGLSPKSQEPGNASYYLSYTRLETTGLLRIDGDEVAVNGLSWFDHEWSTSALGENAQGWDWFGLQLSDGRDLMLAMIRNVDGSINPVSGGTLIEADGTTRTLIADDFHVQALDHWRSPHSDADYPSSWRITIPSADIELAIEPWIEDQEMLTSFVYWEGAVHIVGSSQGTSITGNGYVELTGYAESFQGVF